MTSYGSERLADYIIIVRGAVRVVRVVGHSYRADFPGRTGYYKSLSSGNPLTNICLGACHAKPDEGVDPRLTLAGCKVYKEGNPI